MFTQNDIDWSKCPLETIAAGRPDLPDNIRAFRAGQLDADTLKHAVSLTDAAVQIVQIELPVRKAVMAAAQKLRQVSGEYSEILAGETQDFTADLIADFVEVAHQATVDSDVMDEFINHISALPKSIETAYGTQALNQIDVMRAAVSEWSRLDFHGHAMNVNDPSPKGGAIYSERGYFLIKPLSESATIFLDAKDIRQNGGSFATSDELEIRTERPTLWQGKPYSTLLFTTWNHVQGQAFHAVPTGVPGRTTIAANFSIPVGGPAVSSRRPAGYPVAARNGIAP